MAKMTISSNQSEPPKKEDIGGDCVNEIRQAITDAKISASGRTAASLNYKDDWSHLTIYGDRSGAPIASLQSGNKPQKVDVGVIKQWAIDKGITFSSEKELNSFSYLTAKKIEREGTQRFKEPRNDIYTPALEKAVERFKQRAAAYMQNVIIKELMK